METTFAIREAPVQKVLSVRETCALGEIGATIGRLLSEVQRWAPQHGVPIVGPAFACYSHWHDGKCSVEAGFVVDREVDTGDGRVQGSELGGNPAAFGLHVGAYDAIAQTYSEMARWIEAHGYAPSPTMWEEYLDPPGVAPTQQRTELWWPVQREAVEAPPPAPHDERQ